jgi:hypothetical protein
MAIRDTTVKYFDSTQTGALVISGTAGTQLSVLQACLVDGWGSITPDSIVVTDGIAVLTKSTGHNLVNPGASASLDVGIVVAVSGVTGALAGLNREWRATITSATVLTWECGLANGTAAGTIACKRAPAGWTMPYTGTNKGAFLGAAGGTQCLLRVDDSTTTYSTVKGYKTMSNVDTGVGAFPVAARYAAKSASGDATGRPWWMFADHLGFYLITYTSPTSYDHLVFGDVIPYLLGDAYSCWLSAGTAASYGQNNFQSINSVLGSDWAGSYTQNGDAAGCAKYSHYRQGSGLGGTGTGVVNPVDGAWQFWPVELTDGLITGGIFRGLAAGLWCPNQAGPAGGTICGPTLGGAAGQILRVNWVRNENYRAAFDLIGPWR